MLAAAIGRLRLLLPLCVATVSAPCALAAAGSPTEVPMPPAHPSHSTLVPGLFEITGNPYLGNLHFSGAPLREDQLFAVLDLSRPGLEPVKAAVARGDLARAEQALLAYYRTRTSPPWPGATPEATVAGKRVPAAQASAEEREVADKALRHIFRPYEAYPEVDYGANISWDWDPHGNFEWPAHMHLMYPWAGPVTDCYSATGDERYAQLWVDLVQDWIVKNPLNAPRLHFPNSWDALEVGVRASALIGWLPYYLDSPHCTPEFFASLLTSLYNHARRIYLMPYPQNDNFVIVESGGLEDIGVFLPEFIEAPVWREAAFARLETAVQRQYQPDGVHAELAPHYHIWCTDMLLTAAEHAALAGYRPTFLPMVEKTGDVVLGISAPDGRLLRVGDSDEIVDTRPTLLRLAHLFSRPDFLARATDAKEGAWPAKRNYEFPAGGFYSFRSDWSPGAIWMGLHCGPPSCEQPYAFHAQFDNGTFELMAFGRMLLRDPGVNSYQAGLAEREDFRRTAAHQTLTLNGENSVRAGKLVQWVEDDGKGNASVTVENASYPNLTHRRTVLFVARRYFVLVDEALGAAEGDLDLHFQFGPAPVKIDPASKTARTGYPSGGNVLIWMAPDSPADLASEDAWFSPKHGAKEPAPACRYRHRAHRAPARFVTVLVPFTGAAAPHVQAATVDGDIGADQITVQLEIDGHAYRLTRDLTAR
jgi:heparan-sulfate lyase